MAKKVKMVVMVLQQGTVAIGLACCSCSLIFFIKPFHSRDQQLCKFIGTKRGFYIKKGSTHTGLVWDTNMAFVSLFSWDVKIDLPTSC